MSNTWVDWTLKIEGTGDLLQFEASLAKFIADLRNEGHTVPKYEVSSRNV